MNIKSVKFIKSIFNKNEYPIKNIHYEYAFVGRSNVGKSSLINFLTGVKKIAKKSKKPGTTKYINYYLINDYYYLVDLPGYGYIENLKYRKNIKKIIIEYLLNRNNITCLFILIDSRIELQKIDYNFIKLILKTNINFSIIFTKIDKINKIKRKLQIDLHKKNFLKKLNIKPDYFEISIYDITKTNKYKILKYINYLNN